MTSSDSQVQGSNDWSIASKLSMVQAGYFEDPFISCFSRRPTRRSSLIHRGYYIRARALDYIFNHFLSSHPQSQVVSLGAGYDTSFFRLSEKGLLGESSIYVEIDFPDVIAGKKKLIETDPRCVELVSKGHYHLISVDLRELSALRSQLVNNSLLDPSIPTLFISECAITYMDYISSSKLIEWCGQTFVNATFAVYEQIRPSDGFGLVMQKHFNQLGIPLLSLPILPDKIAQRERYLQKGWTSCRVYDMNEFHNYFVPAEERARIRQLESFDEYEGFHQKCSHYIILTASKGCCCDPQLLPSLESEEPVSINEGGLTWKLIPSRLERYGQAGCLLKHAGNGLSLFAISGGFGTRSGTGHGRLDDLILIQDAGEELQVKKLTDKRLSRMYHSMDLVNDTTLLIYGGRTHPGKALNDVGLYSIHQDRLDWHDGDGSSEWPAGRWRHASCTLNNPSDGLLFICGGRSPNTVLDDCWILTDISESSEIRWKSWNSLPTGRHSLSVSNWKDRLILFGGLNEEEMDCRHPLCLITSTHLPASNWAEVKWNGPPPLARYSHQALVDVANDRLILVGGVNSSGNAPPGVCVIQLCSWTCVEFSLPIQDVSRPIILAGHCASLIPSRNNESENCVPALKIRCWAGGGPCFSFGTHLNVASVELNL